MLLMMFSFVPAANASTVLHLQGGLDQPGCGAGQSFTGAQFILNQIGSARPDSISVKLSNNGTYTVLLTKLSGPTAHYVITYADFGIPPGTTVVDATAVVPANFHGRFVLSDYTCGGGSSSSGSSSGSGGSTGTVATSSGGSSLVPVALLVLALGGSGLLTVLRRVRRGSHAA